MFSLIYKLFKTNLISPKGIFYLIWAFIKHGRNLLAMLLFSSKLYPERTALTDEFCSYTYSQLYINSCKLAIALKNNYNIDKTKKVAILCKNHSVNIQSLVALSRLGTNVVLLNVEMSASQLSRIFKEQSFNLLIYDKDLYDKIKNISCTSLASYSTELPSVEYIINNSVNEYFVLKKQNSGNISVLTGGTSGKVKFAKRKTAISNFIMPFFALLHKLQLDKYKKVYIAVPIYHGYGLASLIVSLVLSSEIYIIKKFNINSAINLIKKNKVQVAILVPTILQRIIDNDETSLHLLKCILSGGAPLSKQLVEMVLFKLHGNLYNLYGTSEVGFSVLALPADLNPT